MKIKYHYVPRHEVKYIEEGSSIEKAYETIKASGFRCLPVLKNDGAEYVGLIFKYDLLEYLFEHQGEGNESIDALVKEKETVVFEEDQFVKVFFTIRRLPFLAVVGEHKEFLGIMTHGNVMDILENSFGTKTGGISLTIGTKERKGAIKELVSTIKDVNIESILTLDNGDKYIRRVIVGLAPDTSDEKLAKIIRKLEDKGYRVPDVERILPRA